MTSPVPPSSTASASRSTAASCPTKEVESQLASCCRRFVRGIALTGAVMSLLEEIRRLSPEAASVLERISFHSETDIMLLDQTDLHEILPGLDNLRVRKEIFRVINQQKQVGTSHSPESDFGQTQNNSSGSAKGNRKPPPSEVIYWLVVKGPHTEANWQLMRKVMDPYRDSVNFVKNQGDHKVTVLLCPAVSRIKPDVAAAMGGITDNKPVILVVMHHAFEPKATFRGKWDDYPNVVLQVNIFHHATKSGLLNCRENNDAIFMIKQELLKYRVPIR